MKPLTPRIFAVFVLILLSYFASGQNFLCQGAPFTTANLVSSNCNGPQTYSIINSTVAGVANSTNANASYTPTGTGTFTVQVSNAGGVCASQTYSVVGFTGSQAACSMYDFNITPAVAGVSYTYNFDGEPFPNADSNGNVNDFDFDVGGTHTASLTITLGNQTCTTPTQTLTVGGPNPVLAFTGDDDGDGVTNNALTPFTYNGIELTVPYCSQTSAPFPLQIANTGTNNTTGTNGAQTLTIDGIAQPGFPTTITTSIADQGFHEVIYTITDNNGCQSEVTYTLFSVDNTLPLSASLNIDASFTLTPPECVGDNICFEVVPYALNPDGLFYEFVVSCDVVGATDYSDPDIFFRQQINISNGQSQQICFTPTTTSCGCNGNRFYAYVFFDHPCIGMKSHSGSREFYVSQNTESDFSYTTPACEDTPQTYQMSNMAGINNSPFNDCSPKVKWIITNTDTQAIEYQSASFVNLTSPTAAGGTLTYTYPNPGHYEVCLVNEVTCEIGNNQDTVCHDVCIEQNFTAVPTWPTTTLFCSGTTPINPTLNIGTPICTNPTVSWTLTYQNGTAVPTSYYTLNVANPLSPVLQVNEKGLYRLSFTISNALCLTTPAINYFNFTVAEAPLITSAAPAAPCPGTSICFDDFICVNDCYSPINAFTISVYAGSFPSCTIPGGNTALWSSSTLPTGSVLTNCLLTNTYCANQYAGFTLPNVDNTTYTVVITATNGCGSDTDCFTFTSGSTQTPTVNLPDQVCAGSILNLTSNAAYQWGTLSYQVNSGSGYVAVPSNGQVTINSAVTFQITSGAACGAPLIEPVSVYPTPQISINYAGAQTCIGEALTITSAFVTGPINTYQWYLNGNPVGTSTASYTIPNVQSGDDIGLTVTYGNGCSQSITTTNINTFTNPINLNPNCFPSTICQDATPQMIPIVQGTGITLTAMTLDGNDIMGSTTINPSTLSVGNHIVVYTYTHNGCTYTSQCSFTIVAAQTVTIVNPATSLCSAQTIDFELSPLVTTPVTWTSNPCPACIASTTGIFTPSTPGTYTISVDGLCVNPATLDVTVGTLPTATITSDDILCASQSLPLSANTTPANATVSWYVDQAVDIPITSPFTPSSVGLNAGTYSVCVEVQDASGCESTTCYPVQVTNPISPAPALTCDPVLNFFCENAPAVPVPTAGTVPTGWTLQSSTLDGQPYTITQIIPGVAPFDAGGNPADDTFQFEFIDDNGCPLTLTCDVNVQANFSPSINTISDLELCPNEQALLTLSTTTSGYGTWQTSNGALINPTTGLFASPTAGNYTAWFSGMCVDSVGVNITVQAPPTGDVTMPAVMCVSQSVPLSGNTNDPSNTVSWYINTIPPQTLTGNLSPSTLGIAAGTYNVCMNIADVENCSAQVCEPIQINNAAPAPVINCNPAFTHMCVDMPCENLPSITLGSWTLLDTLVNGNPFSGTQICAGTAPFVIAANPHTISYSLSDPSGCPTTISCNIAVFDNLSPAITQTNDLTICETETISFGVTPATGSYGAWSTAGPGSIAANGAYTVPDVSVPTTIQIDFGGVCVNETSASLTVNPNPSAIADPTSTLCINETLTLTGTLSADVTDSHWEWNGNVLVGNTIDPDALGMIAGQTYQICYVANNVYPCEVTDCFNLQIIGLPSPIVLDADGWHCENALFTIPNNPSVSYTTEITNAASGAVLGTFNENDSFNFDTSGDFNYFITVESTQGCSITQDGVINVIDDVFVDFGISNYSVCSPSFDITNNSTGMQATYAWSTSVPGGFSSSNNYTPVPANFDIDPNTYGDQTYFVTLTGQNVCSSGTETIEVNFVDVPEIFINASVLSACSEFNSTFTVTCPTTTDISSINYSFNNGWAPVNAANLAPFTYTFTSSYYQEIEITAEVCNQCGCDTEMTTVEVYPPDTEAEFTIPNFLCPGEAGILNDLSAGPDNMVTSWSIQPNNGSVQIANNGSDMSISAVATAQPGIYTITQTTVSPGCGQSTDAQVITIGSLPDLDFSYDNTGVCAGTLLCFQNESSNFGASYWSFGDDGVLINDISPCYTYENGGWYDVTLSSTSPEGCPGSYTESVQIFGPDATISHADSSLCLPGIISFNVPSGEYATLEWDVQLPDSVLHIVGTNPINIQYNSSITEPFLSTVSATITDIFGCVSTNETQVYLKPGVTADFTFAVPEECNLPVYVPMTNLSTDGVFSKWVYDGTEYYEENPTLYITENDAQISLYVVNSFGCRDEAFQVLNCEAMLFVPSAFTPDGDGINDVFAAKGQVSEFKMWIFNRWGEAVYFTEDIEAVWDGDYHDGDYYVQDEVYNWRIEYKAFGGEKKIISGHVTMLR